MKKSILIIAAALCAAFAHGAAVAVRLNPGLSAPDIADGARLEAAVLASTNAAASCTVKAVYELPVFGTVQSVSVVTNDYFVPGTNYVIGTNATLEATGLYTVVSNPTQRVTDIYTVSAAGVTNYYFAATNYFRTSSFRPVRRSRWIGPMRHTGAARRRRSRSRSRRRTA